VTKYTPIKIRNAPAGINMPNLSPTNIIANNTVTNGSANKNELVIAAPTCFIT
jgi:hypothetical protein